MSVFQFTDVRSFLSHGFAAQKASHPRWTLGAWAKQLGLANTASLTRVLDGTRKAGPEVTEKLVRYFKFSENEKTYFQHLVLLDKAGDDPEISVLLMAKLRSLHPKKVFRPLDHETFMAISNWYYFAIREMVQVRGFKEDSEWIARRLRFKVTSKQIDEAIRILLEKGLLKREEGTGRLVQSVAHLDYRNDIASVASKKNHEQNLDNAKVALKSVPLGEREFGSVTLNLSSEKMAEAKKLLREFKDRFIHLMEAPPDQGDQTYHLQFQLFPLTYLSKEESSHV